MPKLRLEGREFELRVGVESNPTLTDRFLLGMPASIGPGELGVYLSRNLGPVSRSGYSPKVWVADAA